MALENSMLVIDGNQIGGRTEDMTAYQTKADNNLQTADKTVVGGINEINAGLATKSDLTDLAPAFSTANAYVVGQYVSYEGNIYKCTSPHSAGAWVAGDFTLVAVGSELSAINSNLNGKQGFVTMSNWGGSVTFSAEGYPAALIVNLTGTGVANLHIYNCVSQVLSNIVWDNVDRLTFTHNQDGTVTVSQAEGAGGVLTVLPIKG